MWSCAWDCPPRPAQAQCPQETSPVRPHSLPRAQEQSQHLQQSPGDTTTKGPERPRRLHLAPDLLREAAGDIRHTPGSHTHLRPFISLLNGPTPGDTEGWFFPMEQQGPAWGWGWGRGALAAAGLLQGGRGSRPAPTQEGLAWPLPRAQLRCSSTRAGPSACPAGPLEGDPQTSASLTLTSSVTWKSSWTTFSTSTMSTPPEASEPGSGATSSWGLAPRPSSASFLARLGFRRGFCLFSPSGSSGSTSSCLLMWILGREQAEVRPRQAGLAPRSQRQHGHSSSRWTLSCLQRPETSRHCEGAKPQSPAHAASGQGIGPPQGPAHPPCPRPSPRAPAFPSDLNVKSTSAATPPPPHPLPCECSVTQSFRLSFHLRPFFCTQPSTRETGPQ